VNECCSGRFEGYRVNCECVPCLHARIVADCLADPRRIPYLLIWTRRPLPIERDSIAAVLLAEPREAVRLNPIASCPGQAPSPGWVEVKRWDGTRIDLQVAKRPLPRRGGNSVLLICNRCQKPRRALYGREAIKHAHYLRPADWLCRECAHLSYASEGGALIYRTRMPATRLLSGLRLWSRPESWEPWVFTSPVHAYERGLVEHVYRRQYKVYTERESASQLP
jgi:hypothetical protein